MTNILQVQALVLSSWGNTKLWKKCSGMTNLLRDLHLLSGQTKNLGLEMGMIPEDSYSQWYVKSATYYQKQQHQKHFIQSLFF